MADAARSHLKLVQPDFTTLERAVADFLEAKSGKSPKTLQGYKSILYQFKAHSAGWPPTPEAIDSFLNAAKARGLKATTIDDYYRSLKTWLSWLHKRGWLESNPIELAERPPRPHLIPRAPHRDNLRRLFNVLEMAALKGAGSWADIRDLAIFSLAYDTGLRVGELAALKVSDITIEKKRRHAFIPGRKTYNDRTVVFHKVTGKDVSRWLAARAKLPLSSNPASSFGPKLGPPGLRMDALFVSEHRGKWRPFTDWGIRQALDRWCDAADIPHMSPHMLRHGYAVGVLRNRGDLLDIQKQLGHKHITTTARYTQVEDEGRQKRHKKRSPRNKP